MSDPSPGREAAGPPRKPGSERVSVELKKLRVSRVRRVSDPGTSEVGREPASADDDLLSLRLGRLHVAPSSRAAAAAVSSSSCPCGRRCRSPGALASCRRRRLVLRPARLKPTRRPLLREPRLVRPPAAAAAGTTGTAGTASSVFGSVAPQRCTEFSQLSAVPAEAAAGAAAPFVGSGAPVFATGPVVSAADTQTGSPPTTACSLQHRQRRPASVDELAGLVAQVSIMSSMAEMMYT